jgi:hypothetical protein
MTALVTHGIIELIAFPVNELICLVGAGFSLRAFPNE